MDKTGDGIIDVQMVYNVPSGVRCNPGDINTLISRPERGNLMENWQDDECDGYPQKLSFAGFRINRIRHWKGFDLSLFFQGAGMTSYNTQNFMTFPFFNNTVIADYEYYNNRWRQLTRSKYPICWRARLPIHNRQVISGRGTLHT